MNEWRIVLALVEAFHLIMNGYHETPQRLPLSSRLIEFRGRLAKQFLLLSQKLFLREATLIHLVCLLLSCLSPITLASIVLPGPKYGVAYFHRLLHLPSTSQHLSHVFRKSQLLQCLINMLGRYSLLLLLLCDLVRF